MARFRANVAAIEVVQALRQDDRQATAQEQQILARWSSWGAIPQVFDETNQDWADRRAQLRGLLGEQAWEAARRTTVNAHYTDPAYVREIWQTVQDLGLTSGQVLEPGSGAGTFIGMAPDSVAMTGVELDPTTAAISQALYPKAAIQAGSFADTRLPDGVADGVVGNVPFADVALYDPVHNAGNHAMHNHFIIKSLALTRPGGMVAVLTSRYTMDATNPAARQEMNHLGDLVGAVRLPTGAHQRAAGTEAVTDLLILRRRPDGEPKRDTSWERATTVTVDGEPTKINTYFHTHPEHVLGEMHLEHGMYGSQTLQVRSDDLSMVPDQLRSALTEVVQQARNQGLAVIPADREGTIELDTALAPEGQQWDGTILTTDSPDRFQVVQNGLREPLKVPKTQRRELRQLLDLRDQARSLLETEASTREDTPELEQQRQQLRAAYDTYLSQHGPLNRYGLRRTGKYAKVIDEATGEPVLDDDGQPLRGEEIMARTRPPVMYRFRTDPHYALVMALESFDDTTQSAAPSTLVTERAIAPRPIREGAETPAEAISLSLNETGTVELARIADLLDMDEGQARDELGTMVYDDPTTGSIVHAPDYLSGDIYTKLDAAREAALTDPGYQVNVDALEEARPEPLGPAEIEPRLGAVWISPEIHQQFLSELLDSQDVTVENPLPGQWRVQRGTAGLAATEQWGTERRPAGKLAEALMNQIPITVNDTYKDSDGRRRSVLNPTETEAAAGKAEELQTRFSEWVWEDPQRATALAAEYNRRFNAIRLRDYSQAGEYLSLPGLAETYTLRPHQRAAVARMISEPTAGLFHQVGAGKTLEMVVGAAEMRRMGLVRKPTAVVPNHMLEQFTREWLQAYPQARILSASSADLEGDKRRLFVARAATNDWDGIVLTHDAFKRIGTSPQTQADYIDRQLAILRESLDNARQHGTKASVKQIEKLIMTKEADYKKKLDTPRDPGVMFEDTGIDYLFVDEAHTYKNLETVSSIPDANIGGSDRATDLHMKLEYLRSQHGPRVATMATATPLANSITEAHVMQRYLRPDLLEKAGVTSFDGWAATFGKTVTQIEMGPAGGFRQKTRFAKFQNVPELLRMWHTFADVKTAADLDLPTPEIAPRSSDGQPAVETISIQPTTELQDYIADIGDRAQDVAEHNVDPQDDNMLKISGDGRRAALDLRLVAGEEPPTGQVKLDAVADTIAAHWSTTRDNQYRDATGQISPVPGSLQLVFCDLGTPSDTQWDAYHELKSQLVERGLPPDEVRFIHEAKNDAEKARLFAAARGGHISVLMGSTQKMGMGTNVQDRVSALHHIDCPWRPADVEQREGRAIRQGNQNHEVAMYRYVVEESFDAYSWQTVARKAEFIAQVMRGDLDVREIDDIGDTALSATEAKAIASGNPLLLDKAEADAALQKVQRQERAHHRAQASLEYQRRTASESIDTLTAQVDQLDQAEGRSLDTAGEAFSMTIGDHTYTKRAEAAEALSARLLDRAAWAGQADQVATVGGHALIAERVSSRFVNGYEFSLQDVPRSGSTHTLDAALEGNIGLIRQCENKVRDIPRNRTAAQAELDRAHRTVEQADERLGRPFPHAEALDAARARVADIDSQLAGPTSTDEIHAAATAAPGGPPTHGHQAPKPEVGEASDGLAQLRQKAADLKGRAHTTAGDGTVTDQNRIDSRQAIRQLRERLPERQPNLDHDDEVHQHRASDQTTPAHRPPSL